MPRCVASPRDAAVADESAAGQYTFSLNLEHSIPTTHSHALTHLFAHYPCLSRTLPLLRTCSPYACYSVTLTRTLSHTRISTHTLAYHSQWHTLSVSRTVPLSHTHAFVHTRTHPLTNYSLTHSFHFSLSYFISLSLSLSNSGVYARACVRVPLSFFLSLSLLHSLSGFLSVNLFLFYTHTRTHAVTRSFSCTHSHAHSGTRSLSPSFSHTHTHFSLFLPLSISLLHTNMDTHTHLHSHTLSLVHSPTHSFIAVAFARCAVFSTRTPLSPLCISPPSSLSYSFPFRIYLFFLSSCPLARLLARRLSLTRSLPLVFNSW